MVKITKNSIKYRTFTSQVFFLFNYKTFIAFFVKTSDQSFWLELSRNKSKKGASLSWLNVCLSYRKPWTQYPAPIILGRVVHVCDPRTWEVRAEVLESHNIFSNIASLRSMRYIQLYLKKQVDNQICIHRSKLTGITVILY